MATKIVVLGASGLLGSWLLPRLKEDSKLQVWSQGRTQGDLVFDPRDAKSLHEHLDRIQPDFVINLIALTNVDLCQTEPQEAYLANALIPQNLNRYFQTQPGQAIQISTDHIYDGPHIKTEDDITIRNVYAMSKLMGEWALDPKRHISLRTNFFGKSVSEKPSFSDWILKSWRQKQKISLFTDMIFTPVHWSVIEQAIRQILQTPIAGSYNLGSSTPISKADFALALAKAFALNIQDLYELKTSTSVASRAPRPFNMSMNSQRFIDTYNFEIGSISQQIEFLKKENP